MSKDSPRTSVLRDNDLIQKGQDDLIRRGDAKARFSERGLAFVRSGLDAIPAVQPDVAELVTLLARAKEELRMIRMKDSGAVYDVLLRTELDAALARVKGEIK